MTVSFCDICRRRLRFLDGDMCMPRASNKRVTPVYSNAGMPLAITNPGTGTHDFGRATSGIRTPTGLSGREP
jgi:hypothetical protein